MSHLILSRVAHHVYTNNVLNIEEDIKIMICRGYMAPEYALWGYLTDKADVYSFGVVALEIVSGKNNNSYIPRDEYICLLDWVHDFLSFIILMYNC